MAKLTVSIAGVDYDRTRAIFDGTVGIEGCETICCAMSPEEAFHRAFRYQEFDITELSLSNTMNLVAKGGCPYVGIPVFYAREQGITSGRSRRRSCLRPRPCRCQRFDPVPLR